MELVIQEEEKGWLSLSVDGDFYRKVAAPLFRKKITRKSFSSTEEFVDWFEVIERKAAKEAGYRLLAMRDYPSEVLDEKLRQKGISQRIVSMTIEELEKGGFINNEAWMARFIEREFRKGVGPRGILAKLWGKKIDKEAASSLVQSMITFDDQVEKIESLFQTKYIRTPKEKAISSLERKGFDLSAILQVAKSF